MSRHRDALEEPKRSEAEEKRREEEEDALWNFRLLVVQQRVAAQIDSLFAFAESLIPDAQEEERVEHLSSLIGEHFSRRRQMQEDEKQEESLSPANPKTGGLIIFVEELGKKSAVELSLEATVKDLAKAAECLAGELRFQGSSFPDASQFLADVGVCQQSEVSIVRQERWRPKMKVMGSGFRGVCTRRETMRDAVEKLEKEEWRLTPEIEKWMSENHEGDVAPTVFSIETWDVSSVTDMDSMFDGATSFNSDISGWNVSSVRFMSSMFNGATAFNIDISGWNTSSVENTAFMFENCREFNIDISGWDLSSVTTMYHMFNKCCLYASQMPREYVRLCRSQGQQI